MGSDWTLTLGRVTFPLKDQLNNLGVLLDPVLLLDEQAAAVRAFELWGGFRAPRLGLLSRASFNTGATQSGRRQGEECVVGMPTCLLLDEGRAAPSLTGCLGQLNSLMVWEKVEQSGLFA